MSNKKYETAILTTDFERDIEGCDLPFSEYPRPMMRRDSYICLNGKWSFEIKREKQTVYSGSITVPFCPESRLSGVEREIGKDDLLIYEREIFIESEFIKAETLLHIGASDQYTKVFFNGAEIGYNEGGYLPIICDVSQAIKEGKNSVRIEVRDPLCLDLPYGKQTDKRGGMWYTKVSGIWQTVWLESLPEKALRSLKITPDLKGVRIKVDGGERKKTFVFEGKEYPFYSEEFTFIVDEPRVWTPDDPYLYEFEIISGEDRISSYFALRTVTIDEVNGKSLICLNGKPIFCHGLLDQGYFPDGIFLPASPRGFEEDILKMKACGFNMLRKHIKLEPELFYYYCDKYGMLVFQDMINSGKYSFFVDTALPTAFLKKGVSHKATKARREHFEKTCYGILDSLYNHPSVIYYTIFNEGWGQFDAPVYYEKLKAADPTRIYDTTSGWFKVEESDVESDHVYFKPIRLKAVKGKPMVLSEFGGYVYKVEGHSFNPGKTYGYKFFKSQEAFENALVALYENEVMTAIDKGLSAAVYTQVSDVEDETNGLMTYDRRVQKVDTDRMKKLSDALFERFENRIK